ncbi:MAG: methyltransferase domain-containing protein, partial [Acidobacteriota bacterium]|nr:methyltransferase domain-containing protein [Acidobacteriota bacterium]
LCEYFARFGYEVTGIDISPDLIDLARERLRNLPFGADHETGTAFRFLVHDIEAAALDEKFDAIVCYDALHHFADEHAVLRHLNAMLECGGQLFVMEGERPPEGSATGEELRGVMEQYETLESPFARGYLLSLLKENGFAIVGDYLSVNGLFERETVERDCLPLVETPAFNYLLCRKVSATGGDLQNSRNPGLLNARISLDGEFVSHLTGGQPVSLRIKVENTGDTLWLVSRTAPKGTVRLGVKVLDEDDRVIDEVHGSPLLPHAMVPGETIDLKIERPAPDAPGRYRLKIDLVCQDICWFEQRGSSPLVMEFVVDESDRPEGSRHD